MTQHQDYYVYALLREDNKTPFYIGKGRGKRINVHEKEAFRDNSHKGRIIQTLLKRGLPVIKIKLVESLLDAQAKQIECDLIQLIGRCPLGPLANLTSGGDGVNNLSDASKAKKSLANVRSWSDPAVRAARCSGIRATWTEEKRREQSEFKKSKMTEAFRLKLSAAQNARWDGKRKIKPPKKHQPTVIRELWKNSEWREKVLENRKANRKPLPEYLRRASALRLNSATAIAKRTATGSRPDIREKRIAAQKAAFSTPEAKLKRSEVSKKMWAAKKSQKALPSASDSESQLL